MDFDARQGWRSIPALTPFMSLVTSSGPFLRTGKALEVFFTDYRIEIVEVAEVIHQGIAHDQANRREPSTQKLSP